MGGVGGAGGGAVGRADDDGAHRCAGWKDDVAPSPARPGGAAQPAAEHSTEPRSRAGQGDAGERRRNPTVSKSSPRSREDPGRDLETVTRRSRRFRHRKFEMERWQPVATDAAETRVTDGKTARWSLQTRLCAISRCKAGVRVASSQEAPSPSQQTKMAWRRSGRCVIICSLLGTFVPLHLYDHALPFVLGPVDA